MSLSNHTKDPRSFRLTDIHPRKSKQHEHGTENHNDAEDQRQRADQRLEIVAGDEHTQKVTE